MAGLSIDHLSPEAVAALVDGELSRKAQHRAHVHLINCPQCRDEVRLQREAARRLQEDRFDMCASGSLIQRLKSIPETCPDDCDVPELQKHYGITSDGCRRPETLTDAVDLLVRRLGRKN